MSAGRSYRTTWRELITEEMNEREELWSDIVKAVFSSGDEDTQFNCGYGCEEGSAFTVWTKNRVYFPVVYDGSEWCGSVARNPNDLSTPHQGGG